MSNHLWELTGQATQCLVIMGTMWNMALHHMVVSLSNKARLRLGHAAYLGHWAFPKWKVGHYQSSMPGMGKGPIAQWGPWTIAGWDSLP